MQQEIAKRKTVHWQAFQSSASTSQQLGLILWITYSQSCLISKIANNYWGTSGVPSSLTHHVQYTFNKLITPCLLSYFTAFENIRSDHGLFLQFDKPIFKLSLYNKNFSVSSHKEEDTNHCTYKYVFKVSAYAGMTLSEFNLQNYGTQEET